MLQPQEFLHSFQQRKQGFTAHWHPDWEILPLDLKTTLDSGRAIQLLDVRRDWEHDLNRLPHSTLIPLDQLPYRLTELDPSAPTVIYCHHGIRSAEATRLLRYAGFSDVRSLVGGTEAWADTVDPLMPRY